MLPTGVLIAAWAWLSCFNKGNRFGGIRRQVLMVVLRPSLHLTQIPTPHKTSSIRCQPTWVQAMVSCRLIAHPHMSRLCMIYTYPRLTLPRAPVAVKIPTHARFPGFLPCFRGLC